LKSLDIFTGKFIGYLFSSPRPIKYINKNADKSVFFTYGKLWELSALVPAFTNATDWRLNSATGVGRSALR